MLAYHYIVSPRVLADESWADCCWDYPKDGRCEHGLSLAAKEHGFRLEHVVARTESEAYAYMRRALPLYPVLLSVDHFSHWITAFRGNSRHCWIIDPQRGSDLRQRLTWRQLLRRLTWGLRDEVVFHFYPLILP